jgi:hypothetical protein
MCLTGTATELLVGTGADIWRSTDGVSFTSTAAFTNYWYGSIAYGNGIYVASGYTGASSPVLRSTDGGASWGGTSSNPAMLSNKKACLGYGSGTFIQTGSPYTFISKDGLTWKTLAFKSSLVVTAETPSTDTYLFDVANPSDSTSGALKRMLTVVLLNVAHAILAEDPATFNHDNRVWLAKQIIRDPAPITDIFTWPVIGNPQLVAHGNTLADVTIAVTTLFNTFAKQS